MTTVHSVTGDQNTIDTVYKDSDARNSLISIILHQQVLQEQKVRFART